jgi:hypothetical protein
MICHSLRTRNFLENNHRNRIETHIGVSKNKENAYQERRLTRKVGRSTEGVKNLKQFVLSIEHYHHSEANMVGVRVQQTEHFRYLSGYFNKL